MSKKQESKVWIDTRLHPAKITIDGWQQIVQLSEGGVGILFVFKTKKQAKKWGAKDLIEAKKEK
jgi:hypothetical protein